MAIHTGVSGDVSYFIVYSIQLGGTTNRGTLAPSGFGALWADARGGVQRRK